MRLIIGGTHSGVGKTTITSALVRALMKRGYKVQPYKVGPDYIDPGYHSFIAGRAARNLDSWMLSSEQVQEVLVRNSPQGGIAVIEGVMGLYDGYSGETDLGSTAHIAKITKTPVVLVVDGAKMARSAAAVVLGYQSLDRQVNLSGVIFNRLGSERHFEMVKKAVEPLGIPVIGYIPRDTEGLLPERHLGLVPAAEMNGLADILEDWSIKIEKYLDLNLIVSIAGQAGPLNLPGTTTLPRYAREPFCNLAVAKDQAFTFYYPENLELLESQGAAIIYVNLLTDRELPENCHGLYIGGGFPELFAQQLAENRTMLRSIGLAARNGLPIYAECGGFMYLTRGIKDFDGNFHPMAGIFDCIATMGTKKQALGYVLAETLKDNFLTYKGELTRGHEFHWSEINREGIKDYVYTFSNKGNKTDGLLSKNVLGSYAHLHFYSNPPIARRFVQTCLNYKNKNAGS